MQHISLIELEVAIDTFSLPATSLPFPAITVCKRRKFDVGEYLRAVFDNFQYVCKKAEGVNDTCRESMLLREHYDTYVGHSVSPK